MHPVLVGFLCIGFGLFFLLLNEKWVETWGETQDNRFWGWNRPSDIIRNLIFATVFILMGIAIIIGFLIYGDSWQRIFQ